MSVGRICIREVDTAGPAETVAVVAGRMHQRAGRIAGGPERCHGTDRHRHRPRSGRSSAGQRRQSDGYHCPRRDDAGSQNHSQLSPIESALAIMRGGSFRRLPVVDEEHKLVGLVSLDDILMLLAEESAQVGRLLEHETPRSVVTGS